jgi:hypothetical protein
MKEDEPMAIKTPALEIYKEAVDEMTNAVNALDQALSMLRDIDLDNYISTKIWGRYVSLRDAVDIANRLLSDLQNVKCMDCGKPMAASEECLSGNCPSLETPMKS